MTSPTTVAPSVRSGRSSSSARPFDSSRLAAGRPTDRELSAVLEHGRVRARSARAAPGHRDSRLVSRKYSGRCHRRRRAVGGPSDQRRGEPGRRLGNEPRGRQVGRSRWRRVPPHRSGGPPVRAGERRHRSRASGPRRPTPRRDGRESPKRSPTSCPTAAPPTPTRRPSAARARQPRSRPPPRSHVDRPTRPSCTHRTWHGLGQQHASGEEGRDRVRAHQQGSAARRIHPAIRACRRRVRADPDGPSRRR